MKLSKPLIMGIVNVTPDSFSDGGDYFDPDKAIAHGLKLLDEGADILDIGGESTRPGAKVVSVADEINRVVPVIKGLAKKSCKISIDTRNSETMMAALDAGAIIVNDVTALTGDEASLGVVAASKADVCLMHMQGQPQTMQENPEYGDVVGDVYRYLKGRIDACEVAGIAKDRIIIDVGIGFGKTLAHNLLLLNKISEFQSLGVRILLGTSRKSFIEKIVPNSPATDRLAGSLASALWGVQNGVDIIRVHDVKETKQALEVWSAIQGA